MKYLYREYPVSELPPMSKSSCNLANDLASILDIATDLADIVISSTEVKFLCHSAFSHTS